MKKINIIFLFILFGLFANARVKGDSTLSGFRLSGDIFKPVEFYLGYNHAMDAGISGQYFFAPHFGLELGAGYGSYHNDNPNIGNLHDFSVSGYYIKPGLLICSKGKAFLIEINYGYSIFSETGKYIIRGPYWGDVVIPMNDNLKHGFLETYMSQSVYATNLFDFKVGLGLDISDIIFFQSYSGHNPQYLPGYGESIPLNLRFLGTINFKIPQKQ